LSHSTHGILAGIGVGSRVRHMLHSAQNMLWHCFKIINDDIKVIETKLPLLEPYSICLIYRVSCQLVSWFNNFLCWLFSVWRNFSFHYLFWIYTYEDTQALSCVLLSRV
jgi:hypothetical protein